MRHKWTTTEAHAFRTDTHLGEVFLDVLWYPSQLVRRGRSGTIATTGTTLVTLIFAIVRVYLSRVEPLKVLGILDGNVGIFDDDHENVLDNRDDEEDEDVHEG